MTPIERAQKAGILIMNEVGLDPGMDHMSAMKIIDEAQRNGSKVIFRLFVYSSFTDHYIMHVDQIFHFLVWWSTFS